MNLLATNLLIAIVWFSLSSSKSMISLIIGFIIGFFFLFICNPFFKKNKYPIRMIQFVKFVFAFTWAFILSNLSMVKIILFTDPQSLHPQFIAYSVPDLEPHQTILLSQCITLTPGTTTIDVSDDYKTITIHCIDAKDTQTITKSIDTALKNPIKAFTS